MKTAPTNHIAKKKNRLAGLSLFLRFGTLQRYLPEAYSELYEQQKKIPNLHASAYFNLMHGFLFPAARTFSSSVSSLVMWFKYAAMLDVL